MRSRRRGRKDSNPTIPIYLDSHHHHATPGKYLHLCYFRVETLSPVNLERHPIWCVLTEPEPGSVARRAVAGPRTGQCWFTTCQAVGHGARFGSRLTVHHPMGQSVGVHGRPLDRPYVHPNSLDHAGMRHHPMSQDLQ